MPFYKDTNNDIHVLDDASFSYLLPAGCVEITADEAAQLQAPTTAQLWSAYQSQAKLELIASDAVATRCVKAGVAYPSNWLSRDVALRAIIAATSGDPTQPLPSRPAYPAGT